MATLQRAFGSLLLEKANGILVMSWDEKPLFQVDLTDRVDGQGSIRARDAIGGRTVEITGDVTGAGNVDTVRTNLGALIAAFRNREDYLRIFTDRRILCGVTDFDYHYPKGMTYARVKWSAQLTARTPTWEAVTASTGVLNITSGTSVTGAMPAHAGDAEVYPEINLVNQGASFAGVQITLINQSTGAQLRLDGVELNSGQSLLVDMHNKRIGDGISIPTMISGISGDFWEISPASTQTLLVVTSATVADLDVEIGFRARYWSG